MVSIRGDNFSRQLNITLKAENLNMVSGDSIYLVLQ